MKSDFLIAITHLAAERNLPKEVVLSALEAALVSAYKKDNLATSQNITVRILPNSGEVKVLTQKTVVEEPTDTRKELTLAEAQEIKQDAVLGDTIEVEITPQYAGRIAAQTAKQVVMQRLREAERELVYEEYSDKEGDAVNGVIHRTEPKQLIVDLGRTEAILPLSECVPTERYRIGQRLKVYILEVQRTGKGPQVIVSRTHRDLLRRIFEIEVPEIYNGTVEIRSIAREPGYRSKVAVSARQEGIDPVGSCVGLRGIRIQNIVNELRGEKIDVVQWDKDISTFIANSLSPAQVMKVEVNEEKMAAVVVVPDKLLSLAIGKEGQNARLAAKLTGCRIDIKSASEAEEERLQKGEEEKAAQVAVAEAGEEVPKEEKVEEEAVAEETPSQVEVPIAEEAAKAPTPAEEFMEPETPPEKPEEEQVSISEAVPSEGEPIEVVWPTVEQPKEKGPVRFAEEIAPLKAAKTKTKSKKGKKGQRLAEKEEVTKSKKGRKHWEASLEEDDDGDG